VIALANPPAVVATAALMLQPPPADTAARSGAEEAGRQESVEGDAGGVRVERRVRLLDGGPGVPP